MLARSGLGSSTQHPSSACSQHPAEEEEEEKEEENIQRRSSACSQHPAEEEEEEIQLRSIACKPPCLVQLGHRLEHGQVLADDGVQGPQHRAQRLGLLPPLVDPPLGVAPQVEIESKI
jgi:hypothetical protein